MRFRSISALRVFWSVCIVGGVVGGTSVADAGVVKISETVANFGTLNQRAMNNACDNNPLAACGPTAVANSFIYLQKEFPKVYDNKLVPTGAGQPQAAVNTLGAYMGCGCNGEPTAAMLTGKMAYIQGGKDATGTERKGVLPGSTVFESQFLTFGATVTGTVPTLKFMVDELKKKEDVEMIIGLYTKDGDKYKRGGGHVVTLTGVSYNMADDGGIGTPSAISFIDPLGTTTDLNGGLTITDDTLTSATTQFGDLLRISNYFASVNNPLWNPRDDTNTFSFIDGLVAESPVPEPSTWALVGAGFVLVAFVRMSSKTQRKGLVGV